MLLNYAVPQDDCAVPESHPTTVLAPKIMPIPIEVAIASPQDNFPRNSPIPRTTTAIVETALPIDPVSLFTTVVKNSANTFSICKGEIWYYKK